MNGDILFWLSLVLPVATGAVLCSEVRRAKRRRAVHRDAGHWPRTIAGILFLFSLWFAASELCWNLDEDVMLGLIVGFPAFLAGMLWLFVRWRRRHPSSSHWLQLLLGNLLVTLLLLSLLMAAGEIYYRFLYDTTESFGDTKTSQRWWRNHVRLNVNRFRDSQDYSMRLQPGRRRVSFVGDSFTVGWGVNDVEGRFGNLVRRAHPEWEVHVLARPGYDTGQEIQMLNHLFAQGYSPDEVVLVYCLNDIEDLVTNWSGLAPANSAPRLPPMTWLRDRSYFIDTIWHRLAVRSNPQLQAQHYCDYVGVVYRGPLWEEQQRRLIEFRDLVKAHGGRLGVVTFPFLHAVGKQYPYRFIHERLDEFWRSIGVPHLDLLPVFERLRPETVMVNRFDAHPNARAHALAAEQIDGFLENQLKEGRPD